jgi:molecular chaperone GrpE
MSNESKNDPKNSGPSEDAPELEIVGNESEAAGEDSQGKDSSAEAQLAQAQKDYLYLRAEFDNYRRNIIKERSDLMKYGSENLLREILNVMDVMDTALGSEINSDNLKSFQEGMNMVAKELRATLNKFGVKEEPSEGKAFDPSLHEALSSLETSEVPEGHIAKVFKRAYRLHDRLIRPAQVLVATAPKDN